MDKPPTTKAIPSSASPLYDQMAANYTPSQAGRTTTDDIASDAASMFSYDSTRDLKQFLREMGGRTFNAQSEIYLLPSDDKEFRRLNKQHYAFTLSFGGLVPCPELADEVLRNDGTAKSVLDIGCGSGIWALEMAATYPHAEVIGVDLAPVPLDALQVPPNCRFEIDDANLGFPHFHGQFDVVHTRATSGGITNYTQFVEEMILCLKPGGLLIVIAGDLNLCHEDSLAPIVNASDTNPDGSWMARICREAKWASVLGGSSIDAAEECIEHGFWQKPSIDPSTCATGSVRIPIGNFTRGKDLESTQVLHYIGALIKQDFKSLHRAFQPLLVKRGISQATLDDWAPRIDLELTDTKHNMSVHFFLAWGRRQDETGSTLSPAVPPPNVDEQKTNQSVDTIPEDTEAQQRKPYQLLRIYRTEAEARDARATRIKLAESLPVPKVVQLHEMSQVGS